FFGNSWYKTKPKPRNTIAINGAPVAQGENIMNVKTACTIVIAAAAFTLPADAHHSFAMFDNEKTITVSGVLKEFEFVNPHCWLHVTVVDPETGKSAVWAFEM